MPWSEYKTRVQEEWLQLLDSGQGERRVQAFFEQHPCLVPGAHEGLGGLTSGHGPFPSALITQPPLSGFGGKRTPDFLWIACDSVFLNPVFIEIEDPAKPYLTKSGQQHHKLTQALHQLDEWRDWFSEPLNRQLFYETYRLPNMLRRRQWEPIYVLVYGQQDTDPDRIRKLRAQLKKTSSQHVIPYEHIKPMELCSDYLCVTNGKNGYVAKSVPPTLQLGPSLAEDRALIKGRSKAIGASPWMSEARKAFLIERLPYWDEWTRHGGNMLRTGDAE